MRLTLSLIFYLAKHNIKGFDLNRLKGIREITDLNLIVSKIKITKKGNNFLHKCYKEGERYQGSVFMRVVNEKNFKK